MSNQKIVLASILGAILATSILALNPSTITSADAQMYGNYDNHPKKSSDVNVQKIKCVNSNINVNGIDITQIPQDGTANLAAANEETLGAANTQNGNGLDIINFDRNLVNICLDVNLNEQTRITPPPLGPATLSVSKTISCTAADTSLQSYCNFIVDGGNVISIPDEQITPDEFNITVTGNNPNPSNFDGSNTPVIVTLDAGSYQVSETVDPTVQATIDAYRTFFTVVISGPTATFSGDCNNSGAVTIVGGEQQNCNIDNAFFVDFPM